MGTSIYILVKTVLSLVCNCTTRQKSVSTFVGYMRFATESACFIIVWYLCATYPHITRMCHCHPHSKQMFTNSMSFFVNFIQVHNVSGSFCHLTPLLLNLFRLLPCLFVFFLWLTDLIGAAYTSMDWVI